MEGHNATNLIVVYNTQQSSSLSPAIPILISFDFSCTAIAQLPEYEISPKNRGPNQMDSNSDILQGAAKSSQFLFGINDRSSCAAECCFLFNCLFGMNRNHQRQVKIEPLPNCQSTNVPVKFPLLWLTCIDRQNGDR